MQPLDKPLDFLNLLKHLETVYQNDPTNLVLALDAMTNEASRCAMNANKAAVINLKLTFKPGRHGEMAVTADISSKDPKPEALPGHFYQDNRGRLCLTDPRQPTFENVIPLNGDKEKAHG